MFDELSMAALLETYLAESEDGLQAAEEGLLALERDRSDEEALGQAFRAVHTMKGNAGLFGFEALGAVAHAMEDVLDRVRDGSTIATNDTITRLLEAVDMLRSLLVDEERERDPGPAELQMIERLHGGKRSASGAAAQTPVATSRSARTLRIDVSRLSRLLDLGGEIAITRGHVAQLLLDPSVSKRVVLEAHRDAGILHEEMQELVMKLRMVPVGPAFRQLHRVVRDTALALGKEATLRIDGADVEVDMTIIEHLRDPLIHMIRNSVGHGIETIAGRKAAGKPQCGQLLLRSFHDSGSVVIELSDDGRGIDRQRVMRSAVERGLVAAGHQLSDSELLDLIFHPGLSTAESVTDLSGRGVGLDVVRRNLEAIHGSVSVESRAGSGTLFRLRLPLTLAIVEGLRVGIGSESFIIPMDCVIEATRLPAETDTYLPSGVLTYRNETIPFLRLCDRLSPGAPRTRENVVIVRYPRGRAALVVNELHGECQTVVKPLPRWLRGTPGISGSAILPSGSIAFILDVPALLQVEIDRSTPTAASSPLTTQESSCSAN